MERERLTALAMTFLLLSSIRAGEIKTHQWPSQLAPPQIVGAEIPVLMDIGFYISVVGRPRITIRQTGPGTYTGCTSILVRCNTGARLSASITPTGAVKGTYSCSILNWIIDAPGGVAVVCAKVENAERCLARSVQVAVIEVSVTPR